MGDKKRIYLKKSCSKEEMNSLKLIQNNLTCATQAASPESIPDNVDKDKAVIFIAGAIEAKARALWLQDEWWDEIVKKYEIEHTQEDPIYIDFITLEFYKIGE